MSPMAVPMQIRNCVNNFTFSSKFLAFTSSKCVINQNAVREISQEASGSTKEIDVAALFIKPEVQSLLTRLTRKNHDKLFRTKKLSKLGNPSYYFMTESEYKEAKAVAEKKAKQKLQMPPVLNARKPIDAIITKDDALNGLFKNKIVCTDITYGLSMKERTVVVRETDGTLRKGTWDEKIRMHNLYFPQEHREIFMPSMFKPEYIKIPLNLGHYEFLLNRACIQFEPDDPDFIRVCQTTYEHINDNKRFDSLSSTRHFGPMTFHLTINKKIDDLLNYFIVNEKIEDGAMLVHLYKIIHSNSKSDYHEDASELVNIESYIKNESVKKPNLEIAMKAHKDLMKQKKQVTDGLAYAHGNI